MPIPSNPEFLESVIGEAADVLPIPAQDYTDPTQNGALNYKTGWPAITALPLEAGGKAPRREYFNALMQLLSSHIFFQQSGSLYPWSDTLDYLTGAHVLGSDGKEYIAQKSNGPDVPDSSAVDPVGDESGTWLPAGSVYAPLATPDTPGIMRPDNTTCTVENGVLTALGVNQLHKLGDGELNLYVRPDGSDSNDGTANTPESAWATIEHAVAWISERRFTGGGLVTVNIADGTYTPGVSALNNGGQFPNPFTTYKSIPDVINPTDCERWRVRLVGNLSSPSSVVISIDPNYDSFYISNMKVCGVTFVKSGTPSVSVDSVVGIVSGCLANVRIVVGIPSPYYVLRVDNSNLYGSIEINAQSSVAVKNELLTFYGQNPLIGYYSIALNSLNPGQRPAYISLTGTTMSASYTVSVAQGNKLTILSGSGSGASSGNSTFTGSISASRYYVAFPSVIYSNGLGVNFFPGTSAGAASMPSSLYL